MSHIKYNILKNLNFKYYVLKTSSMNLENHVCNKQKQSNRASESLYTKLFLTTNYYHILNNLIKTCMRNNLS